MTKVEVPFNGIESELGNLAKAGITVMGLLTEEGNGNTVAVLQGEESVIRGYLAGLWDVEVDGEEIEELFENY
jgi:hypothetical protein